jgi:hypothetical protein
MKIYKRMSGSGSLRRKMRDAYEQAEEVTIERLLS